METIEIWTDRDEFVLNRKEFPSKPGATLSLQKILKKGQDNVGAITFERRLNPNIL